MKLILWTFKFLYVIYYPSTFIGTTSEYFSKVLLHQQLHRCTNKITKFHNSPPVLILAINNNPKIDISKNMTLLMSMKITDYELKGMIYLGDFHFTVLVIYTQKLLEHYTTA
jgi:hypothetical protein